MSIILYLNSMKKKIVILIISLVLLFGIIFIILNNDSNEKEIEKNYKELTNVKLIKDINKKINYISSKNGKLFKNGIIETFYFNDSFLNKLSDEDKAYIVLDSFVSESKLKKCFSFEKVNNRYNSLFGEDIPSDINISNRDSINYKFTNKEEYCIKNKNKYDLKGYMYMYTNRFITNDKYIKAYVNYGMSGDVVSTDKWIIYDSLDNSIYKAGLSLDEVKEFRIDNTNYSEFIEYEYLFKKKDNNYYLVSVKEI